MEEGFSQIVLNVKEWEESYPAVMQEFLGTRIPNIKVVGEKVGTLEGSGCAILNCLSKLNWDVEGPFLVLLCAGEGSRLWGLSISNGFIKGLLDVFGKTLIEQSHVQCSDFMSQAPPQFMIVSGTDNIFKPQFEQLRLEDGTLFKQSTSKGLHCFSIPFRVRDENGTILENNFARLSQLGIMVTDKKGTSVAFIEKPTEHEIRQTVDEYCVDTVYANAFIFAMSKEAAQTMKDIYSKRGSGGAMLYERKDFDWSADVLSTLSFIERNKSADKEILLKQWMESGRTNRSKKIYPDDQDWALVLECGLAFHQRFGGVKVLNCGEHSVWYDCGLASEYQTMLLSDKKVRDFLKIGEENVLIHSTFDENVTFGKQCVVVNTKFKKGLKIRVPERTIFVNCEMSSEFEIEGENCVLYGISSSCENVPNLFKKDHVYFGHMSKEGTCMVGSFPIYCNPKNGGKLDSPFPELGRSFRDLQTSRDISLTSIMHTMERNEKN